jgi:cyclophilin family peptidyl-prolyl cis-trans isomerase
MNNNTLPAVVLACVAAGAAHATDVAVCTDQGNFVMELADTQSPRHVENFLAYVDIGYYSGTVFHRVVPGFVVQGGGVDRGLRGRPSLPPVPNESQNGLSNRRGSIAAARTSDVDSATSQFFVNLDDNTQLDAGAEPGYTVFARVKEGIQVLDQMSRLPTGGAGPFTADVPTPLVAIRSITRLDAAALADLPEEGREAVLKERITAAAAAENYAEALQWITHYRAICGTADSQITVLEATAALATDNRPRAVFVLEEYFATTQQTDPTYEDALVVYRTAVPENQLSPAQLVGDCEPPAPPALPDALAASLDEMIAGQTRVRDFVAAGEVYLACVSKVIDDPERTTAERNAATGEHNRMVGALEQTAARFNAQIRVFKARE